MCGLGQITPGRPPMLMNYNLEIHENSTSCVNHQIRISWCSIGSLLGMMHTLARVKQTLRRKVMSRPYLIHYQQHKLIITSRASPCLISILRWLIGWRNSIPHHLDNILMIQIPDHLGTRRAAVPFWQEALPPHPHHCQLQGLHQDQEHRALRQRHLHLHGWVAGGGELRT